MHRVIIKASNIYLSTLIRSIQKKSFLNIPLTCPRLSGQQIGHDPYSKYLVSTTCSWARTAYCRAVIFCECVLLHGFVSIVLKMKWV